MLKLISRFGTNKHIQYSRYFLLEYNYVPDAYYKSVFSMPKHKQWLQKFQQSNPVHIIGGDRFPKDGKYLVFNCADENIPLKFVAQDSLIKDKIVTKHSLIELTKTSSQKFNVLNDFFTAQ